MNDAILTRLGVPHWVRLHETKTGKYIARDVISHMKYEVAKDKNGFQSWDGEELGMAWIDPCYAGLYGRPPLACRGGGWFFSFGKSAELFPTDLYATLKRIESGGGIARPAIAQCHETWAHVSYVAPNVSALTQAPADGEHLGIWTKFQTLSPQS